MMFAFRVSTLVGIGHVMRMKWLALELQNRGYQSIFILDYDSEHLLPFLVELNSLFFYLDKKQLDEREDALQTLQFISAFSDINTVILDSYELGKVWECTLKAANKKVVVFDDLAREHDCDILFDAKWLGANTEQRYQGKISEDCLAFLGPQYAILSPAYKNSEIRKFTHDREIKKILMSLGGGGDLRIIAKLVAALYQELNNQAEIETTIVIGPKAENIHLVEKLAKQYGQVTLLYQPKCLAKHYSRADLFVGALGTSLYELAATKTPAITFSIADNQQNNYCDLADLGHYLHLPSLDIEQFDYVGKLIISTITQLPRLIALREFPFVEVDGNGASHIVDILLNDDPISLSKVPLIKNKAKLFDERESLVINDSISIYKVNDKDINHYRQSRNLPNNSERMTIQTEIKPLEHYLWWFNNRRESYVLYQNELPLLYIWHQDYLHQGSLYQDKQYLYGGWFTAQGNVPFNIAILALKWQLEYTQTIFPQGHWLAVINKENKFVNLLNQYMGFSKTDTEQESFLITQKFFPQALTSEFNFVELDFDKNNQ
jgi:UDP-2,4-diacetamido-2,4,6-trideoxy-beta-L-altropyranose hydrolase